MRTMDHDPTQSILFLYDSANFDKIIHDAHEHIEKCLVHVGQVFGTHVCIQVRVPSTYYVAHKMRMSILEIRVKIPEVLSLECHGLVVSAIT